MATTAGLAPLLLDGIGDTIRVSLTPQPGGDRAEEVRVARQVLQSLGIRSFEPQVTSCPGCGRTTSTFFQEMAEDITTYIRDMMPVWRRDYPGVEAMDVAVMGCVVNGPGEARDADLGIAAGNKRGHLFVKGRNVAVVPEAEMVDALVDWAEYIQEHGTDAAIARADTRLAEREADKDRRRNLGERGDDANDAEHRIELVRKRAE